MFYLKKLYKYFSQKVCAKLKKINFVLSSEVFMCHFRVTVCHMLTTTAPDCVARSLYADTCKV
jgi:hypothetical protein